MFRVNSVLMRIAACLVLPAVLTQAQCIQAQGYPAKPIRLVLPVAPGGGSDIIVRIVTQKLNASLGQQFVIDYRGGANGNIAHDLVAKAVPDGYTLLWVNAGIATNTSLYRKLNHDPVRDFTPITQLTSRSALLPAAPTVAEQGYPRFEVNGWFGMLAPTGAAKESIALLHAEIVKALRLPDVGERLTSDGAVAVGSSPDEFGAYIRAEMAKWVPIIKASGATAD